MYPQHWLLQFGGLLGDPLENWTCGIRLSLFGGGPFDPETVDEEDYLDTIAVGALEVWFESIGAAIGNDTSMTFVKFNEIGPDGRYADPALVHERAVAFAGGGGGTRHPLQVSMVLSWRTDAAVRGPGSHGRIYSPRPAVSVSATGADVDGPARVAAADAAALLLNTLDVDVDPPSGPLLRPSIVSAVGLGVANQIDTVVVDSRLDVQRRRAFSQSAEITSAPVTY